MEKKSTNKLSKPLSKNKDSVFHHQLEQLKVDLKSAQDDGKFDKIKEISRHIRNLEAIIKRIDGY